MRIMKAVLLTTPIIAVAAVAAFWLNSQRAIADPVEVRSDDGKVVEVIVEGVNIPTKLKGRGGDLTLNGCGLRSKWGFNVYVAALYLNEPNADSEHIMQRDRNPKHLHIAMLRKVSAKKFTSTIGKNIEVNFTADERTLYAKELAAFLACFGGGESLQKGSVIHVDFVPGSGTHVAVDGKNLDTIAGDDFYHALLRLWIGDPPQESMKHGLLGKGAE